MRQFLAGLLALGAYKGWADECGVKEYWTENCTACPGDWYATCSASYSRVGERGCGFLNAGCQIQCRKDFGPCPVDCEVSEWSGWGACTEQCTDKDRDGNGRYAVTEGTRVRTRTVTQSKKGKGQGCPDLSQRKNCEPKLCKPSQAGDKCKSLTWYKFMCSTLTPADDAGEKTRTQAQAQCKKNGCNWKNEECIPHKLSKKVKCKKVNKGSVGKESICECFANGPEADKESRCTFDWKPKKKGKKAKKSCLGSFKWKKPE